MMIWINGTFGAGKTQAAYELRRKLPGACVYDPEDAGYFIRKSLPPALRLEDFQDYPLWRTCVREQICYIAERWPGPIIVPMTITNRGY